LFLVLCTYSPFAFSPSSSYRLRYARTSANKWLAA
jgi:hypothetical protein